MRAGALPLYDADAHVIEPPWVFEQYSPRAYRERVPRLDRRGRTEWIVCDGMDLFPIGRLGGLARNERHLRLGDDALEGSWHDVIVPGAHEIDARLAAMDTDGIACAVLFPTVAMRFFSLPDPDLRNVLFRALNAWTADLHRAAPTRLRSICVVDPDDLDAAVAEVRGARDRGHAGVLVPLLADRGWTYGSTDHDVLWRAAAEQGLPVGFHAFASRGPVPVRTGLDLALDAVVERPSLVMAAIAQLIFSGTFDRVPELRWFSAENDAGWCPYLIERSDTLFDRVKGQVPTVRRPSEQFREHVFVTYTHERAPLASLPITGSANLLWGSDYPHNITTWPTSQARLDDAFAAMGTPPETVRALVHDNAARLFG
jgi:predicted TIM-barrel fold metal-dependent hydrolase